MKIRELLSKPLDEGLASSIGSKLFAKPLAGILGAVGRGTKSTTELANYVNSTGRDAGKLNIARIKNKYGEDFTNKLIANPSRITKIEAKAAALKREAAFTADIQAAAAVVSNLKTAVGTTMTTLKWAFNGWLGWETIGKSIMMYNDNVEYAGKLVESGQWTLAEFHQYRLDSAGFLFGKVSAVIMTLVAARMSKGIVTKLLQLIGIKSTGLISTALSGTTGFAVWAALMTYIASEQGSKLISGVLLKPLFDDIPRSSLAVFAANAGAKIESELLDLIKGAATQSNATQSNATQSTIIPDDAVSGTTEPPVV